MDSLTDEEWEVQQALKDYRWEPDRDDAFVPTRVLYQVYRQFVGGLQWREAGTSTLSMQQFGVALSRVYPFHDEGPDAGSDPSRPPNRVRRTWHGKRMWGYLGLVGPETVATTDQPGRPKRRLEHDDET